VVVAVGIDVDPVDRPVTGAAIGGGALVGFESMISTVVPGW
jgi:hypothetical protein